MKVQKTRFIVKIFDGETIRTYPLFDRNTGEGTSGEGKAFNDARALLKASGIKAPFTVEKVKIESEVDIAKAVNAGAVSEWTIVE